jgi:hypothetical protein
LGLKAGLDIWRKENSLTPAGNQTTFLVFPALSSMFHSAFDSLDGKDVSLDKCGYSLNFTLKKCLNFLRA